MNPLSTPRRGPALALGYALFLAAVPALAQTPADPRKTVPEPRDHAGGTVILEPGDGSKSHDSMAARPSEALDWASKFPAIYDAAGEDMRTFAQHDMALADPFFEGRYPGTRGNKLAAEYIEFHFKRDHLLPAFPSEDKAHEGSSVLTPNTSFRQTFSQGNQTTVEDAAVTLDLGSNGEVTLKPEEFTVLGSSGTATVTAPIALCGYGIADGKDGYTNFPADTDLKGKIAVVFRFEPMNDQGKSRWAEDGWSPAASLDTKIDAAIEHHAAGIIVVNPPGVADPRGKKLLSTQESRPFGKPATVPIVMISTPAADRLVHAADSDKPLTLAALRTHFDEHSVGPMDLPGVKATLTTRMSYNPVLTDNVGGVLRGKGKLADQYIIITSHYDHLGYGSVGVMNQANVGQLHPGADDNASGTSGVMVLADKLSRAYAALPDGADARSVLFMTFSGEESGLIGSHYYVAHPSVDLAKQCYLELNMDMIGRLRSKSDGDAVHGLEVQGTESAEGLYEWLTPFFDKSGLEILHGSEVASNSDHASFYTHHIPVLFFFTGLHRQYHTPQDTAFTINPLGAAKVIDLVYDIALAAAQREGTLKFTPRREQAKDNDQPAVDPNLPKGVGHVRFGIAPASYSDDKPGVEVGDVYEGTSAADAGIKPGDRLTKWNGKDIANVEAWMPMLTAHKPGDTVDVTLLRDGKEMTVKVKLKARDSGGK